MVNKAEWLNNVYRDTGYSTVETSAGSQVAAGESSPVDGLATSPLAPLASPKAPRGQKMMKGLTGVVHKVKGTRCGAALWEELKAFFLDTKLNVLLVCLPLAIVSHQVGWGDGPTFVLSCLALVSLAERLGFVTENLASYTNDTLGGLLNASFGNATEVIISAFALKAGYLRVVQLTLLGSIISNLLLVMGSAFLLGGMKRSHQQFNRMSSSVSCSLLMLSSFVILLPSLLSETHTEASVPAGRSELTLSRFESVCMLICYGLFLVFQLYTHRHLYEDQPEEKEKKTEKAEPPTAIESAPATRSPMDAPSVQGAGDRTASGRPNAGSRTSSGRPKPLQASSLPLLGNGATEEDVEMQPLFGGDLDNNSSKNNTGLQPRRPSVPGIRDGDDDALGAPAGGGDDGGDDDDDDEPVLSRFGCFVWLTVITLFVSLLSEYIMDALTGAAVQLHIPLPFLTTILLPIVGNAAEHASALVFAYKNRIEISLGVAVGSSTQVGVLVVPFCVVMGWAMGQPLDLDFNTFEAMVLFLSVMLAAIVLQDGHSNWIKGCVLMFSYVFIAGGFWCHKDTTLSIQQVAGH